MLKHAVLGLLLFAATTACTDSLPPTEATQVVAPLFVKGGNVEHNFGTHLTGAEEVLDNDPHPSSSRAQGQAQFRVSKNGSSVDFRLIVANIENVIMAHIHCGRPGENGPIAVWLHPVIGASGSPAPAGQGRFSGVLAAGTFTPAGINCAAANVGADMPLLDAIRAGLTYVNVHTNDGIPPTNTGPGDFPGGEVRGQINHPSKHGF